jgi:hypothetical protein
MSKERRGRAASARVRDHIRSHVIGYVALFVALSGVAYANDGPLAGQNTVGSADIINGEVYNQDVQANAIGSGKVIDNSLTKDDLGPQSVGYTELDPGAFTFANDIAGSCNLLCSYGVKNDAIQSREIQDGQVTSSDIENGGVTRGDLAANAKPTGFWTTLNGTGIICNNGCTEGSLPLPKGTFAISAKILIDQDLDEDLLDVECNLVAGDATDTAATYLTGVVTNNAGSSAVATLPMDVLANFSSAGNANVNCRDFDVGDATGRQLKIVAVQVG